MSTTKHVTLLVDASGSMVYYVKETKKSIRSIMKSLGEDVHFTLVFFDSGEYKIVANSWANYLDKDIGDSYAACDNTPITDSVYKAIQDTIIPIDDIGWLSEEHRIIIFTDGAENSSTHVTSADLGRAIEHFTDNFGWNFQFIGPKSCERGITSYTNSIKIRPENVTLYASVADGLKAMERLTVA